MAIAVFTHRAAGDDHPLFGEDGGDAFIREGMVGIFGGEDLFDHSLHAESGLEEDVEGNDLLVGDLDELVGGRAADRALMEPQLFREAGPGEGGEVHVLAGEDEAGLVAEEGFADRAEGTAALFQSVEESAGALNVVAEVALFGGGFPLGGLEARAQTEDVAAGAGDFDLPAGLFAAEDEIRADTGGDAATAGLGRGVQRIRAQAENQTKGGFRDFRHDAVAAGDSHRIAVLQEIQVVLDDLAGDLAFGRILVPKLDRETLYDVTGADAGRIAAVKGGEDEFGVLE